MDTYWVSDRREIEKYKSGVLIFDLNRAENGRIGREAPAAELLK
jgi:hypothetical protein